MIASCVALYSAVCSVELSQTLKAILTMAACICHDHEQRKSSASLDNRGPIVGISGAEEYYLKKSQAASSDCCPLVKEACGGGDPTVCEVAHDRQNIHHIDYKFVCAWTHQPLLRSFSDNLTYHTGRSKASFSRRSIQTRQPSKLSRLFQSQTVCLRVLPLPLLS